MNADKKMTVHLLKGTELQSKANLAFGWAFRNQLTDKRRDDSRRGRPGEPAPRSDSGHTFAYNFDLCHWRPGPAVSPPVLSPCVSSLAV